MAIGARIRSRPPVDIWPGFVDALATLLIIIIFTLMVFVVAQFYLTDALGGRNREVDRLSRQIAELADLLALEQSESEGLRSTVDEMAMELQATLSARQTLARRLAGVELALSAMSDRATRAETDLAAAEASLESLGATLSAREAELAAVRTTLSESAAELAATRGTLSESAAELAVTWTTLSEREGELAATRTTLSEREGEVSDLETSLARAGADLEESRADLDRTRADLEAARDDIAARDDELNITRTRLAGRETELADAIELISRLNRQIAAIRAQLAAIEEALDAEEAVNLDREIAIRELTARLNVALAERVQTLEQYRSEFFGRLREVLGERAEIRIVGDRFVFQSEVLFQSGSAEIGEGGRLQVARLATTLREIAGEIPEEIDWILRVDGHTDRRPINTWAYASNWELSFARALAVVNTLIGEGIPAERLAATGFGEFQPLDEAGTEDAWRRNRRIEIRFDTR